jgi:uncharacterized membrane protein
MKVSRLALAIVLSTSTIVVEGFFFFSPSNHNSNPTGKAIIDVEEEEEEPLTMEHLRKQLQLRKDQPVVEEPSSSQTTNVKQYTDAMIRMEYNWWLPKHGKEADPERYPRFKTNWISQFEHGRESGDYFSLNEFADCTEEEYKELSTSQRQVRPCPEYTASMIQQEYTWWCQNFDKQPSLSRYLQFKNNWVQLDAHGRATGEYFPLNENGDRTEQECLEILNQKSAQDITASIFESIMQPEVVSNPMAAYDAAMGIFQAAAATSVPVSVATPGASAFVAGRNIMDAANHKEHPLDPMAVYDAAMAAVRMAAVASVPLTTAPTNNNPATHNMEQKDIKINDRMAAYAAALAVAQNPAEVISVPGAPEVAETHNMEQKNIKINDRMAAYAAALAVAQNPAEVASIPEEATEAAATHNMDQKDIEINDRMAAYAAALAVAQNPAQVASVPEATEAAATHNMDPKDIKINDRMAAYAAALAVTQNPAEIISIPEATEAAATSAFAIGQMNNDKPADPMAADAAAMASSPKTVEVPKQLVMKLVLKPNNDPTAASETAITAAAASAPLTKKETAGANLQPVNTIPVKPVVVDPHASAASAPLTQKKVAAKPLNKKPAKPFFMDPDIDQTAMAAAAASAPLTKKAAATKLQPVKKKKKRTKKPTVVMDPYLEEMVEFQCGFY